MSVPVGKRRISDSSKTKMFYAVDEVRKLAAYTVKICANEKVFDPKYHAVTDKITAVAMDAYYDAWNANYEIKVVGYDMKAFIKRQALQESAISRLNDLLPLIDFTIPMYHLKGKRVKYWGNFVRRARGYLIDWKDKEYKTFYDKYVNN